jgi:soluble lytic murein transglycosylase-like protein
MKNTLKKHATKDNIIIALAVWSFTFSVFLNIYTVQSQIESIMSLQNFEHLLDAKVLNLEYRLDKNEEKVFLLDIAVSTKDKLIAKQKKIKKIIQDTITQNQYRTNLSSYDINILSAAVVEFSESYGMPASLILAVIRRESAFDPKAESRAGALGLMQLLPDTAKECAVALNKGDYNIYKLRDNVQLGTYYLAKMVNMFNGDIELAVRAYNAGPTYVKRVLAKEAGFEEFPKETIKYHEAVLKWNKEYQEYGL